MGDAASKKEKEAELTKLTSDHKNFIAFVTSTIGADKLEKVSFMPQTMDAAAVLVAKDGQQSAQMQKVLKAM